MRKLIWFHVLKNQALVTGTLIFIAKNLVMTLLKILYLFVITINVRV